MSLKTKIPLLVAVMLLLNIAVVILYNRLYFLDKVAEKIEQFSGRPVDAEMLRGSSAIWELVVLEIVIICVIVFAVGIVVYLTYARPMIRLNGMVGAYRDGVIDSTVRRDEIGQLQNSFHRLSQNLRDEKQTQNRIIASISHDIKTPLTSVLGYSERLLKKETERERLLQYLKKIHSSAKDISSIVEEFDDYIGTVIPEGLKMQEYTVTYICQMLKDEYKCKIDETGGVLSIQNHCGSDDIIRVDLLGFRRVCANIIGNSIRHSGADKLEVKIVIQKNGEHIVLRLSDNGKGVSESELNHIFEPFYTSDKSRKLSGLGLAICKQIVETMNGSISASVTEKKGLSIVIILGCVNGRKE